MYPIKYKTDNNIIYSICFSSKGEVLGVADNNTIKIFNTKTAALLQTFENTSKSQILSIDISKDSTLLVCGGKDSTIVIWDFINKIKLKTLTYSKGIITTLKISADRKYIAWGDTDNKVYLYNIEKSEVISVFSDHTNAITAIDFSPDSKYLAAASGDMTISIYSIPENTLIKSLIGHRNWVRDVCFSENGEKLISCGDDSRIIIWDVNSLLQEESILLLKVIYSWIVSVDYNPDNKSFVIGSLKGKIFISTPFIGYIKKVRKPINMILFKPNEGKYMVLAVATRGNGVYLIPAEIMRSKIK